MRRFSLWLRERPMVADSMLAGLLFALEIASAFGRTAPVLYVITGAGLCLPLVCRRRHPRAAATVVLVMSIVCTITLYATDDLNAGENSHPGVFALAISLYTLVAYVGRRAAAYYAVGLVVDTTVSILLLDQDALLIGIFSALAYTLSWILAEFLGARRAYDEEVAARLTIAEFDRDRRAEDAVYAERTRIARELHDVVAHAVSVMIVQADGASYALHRDPEKAERALSNIAGTGRQALSELRRTVALLRSPATPDEMPQHGTAGLARVVETMREAGLAVELVQSGAIDDVSPSVSLGVHRLVQESLTNVLRHSGANPKAWVHVARRDCDVLVEVVDNGSSRYGSAAARKRIVGSGNGLVGMRERVAVLGGTLEAGRRPDGGWTVRAEIPLDPDE
ncbi:sensor histidine kinase [Rhodococcus sp. TAF43]|uniref:sensor histidine kinase n=1 Tax=unclassified Rhodococcus (in: high G+C Gram-positive bacteria) TaxID=192944 RepID=UPI001582674A|nr:sensor histidine kinase [Rhodococcus sp. W8901]QKT11620.1 sensor histidine kinase [Rhodococcus sp. W8901]